ncbi:MAG: type II secretion system protein GspN [Bdellovibrionales bacterium]|nr:type II secretion system protein GspN [Bdellovibrionales bacterium]
MKKLSILIFAAGLIVGMLLFFPYTLFTSQAEQMLLEQSGIQAQLGNLHLGTGLTLGLNRGGLIALKGEKVRLTFATGKLVVCEDFALSPQILPLFMGQARVTIACDTRNEGSISASVAVSPVWSPATVQADVSLDKAKLTLADAVLPSLGLVGSLSGDVNVSMPIKAGMARIPDVQWNLSGDRIVLPSVSSNFLTLPSISVGSMKSKGRLPPNGKANIEELRFGDKGSPMEGAVSGTLVFDRQGIPTDADIRGRLRTDPEFEKNELKGLNLDLMFGPIKGSGQREFKKQAQGSLFGLLMNPPLDN